jgi:Spy/CpxP family protein refolding chaperone
MNGTKSLFKSGALALAIALGTTAGLARAEGPAGHAAHAARAAGGLEMAIGHVRAKLNLSAEQSSALDAIVATAKAQARAARDASKATIEQMKAELAKPQPNLRTLTQLQESMAPQREAIRKSMQAQLLNFYDTLNASQQATVVEGLRKMAAMRERRAARWTD